MKIVLLFLFLYSMRMVMNEPVVVTSLIRELTLPKNPLINPFYDPEFELLRNHHHRRRRSIDALNITDTDIDDLTERPTIDSTWENLIVNGPTAVNLFGQIMVLSSKVDFSFREANPDQIFLYIKYPDSFRATLTQVSNEAWRAFLLAHINMDKLQLNMQRIPNHVKVALRILNEVTSVETLNRQMSKTLNVIQRIGNDCINLSNETHWKFANLMNQLGEIISLTEVSQGWEENQLRQTEIQLNISQVWQEQLTQLNIILKEHYQDTLDDLKSAHMEYSRALARRPSVFERTLMRIAGVAVKLIKNGAKIFQRTRDGQTIPSVLNSLANGQVDPTTENGKALIISQSLSSALKNFIFIYQNILYPTHEHNSTHNPMELENLLQEMNAYTQLMGNNSISINIVQPIVIRLNKVCNQAIQLARDSIFGQSVNRNETDDVLSQLQTLVEDMKKIDTAAGLIEDASLSQRSSDQTSYSADNWKMLVQITERKLQDARTRSQASLVQLQKNMDDMTQLVAKIASLDLTRITRQQLIDFMRQALSLLATIRQTWGQLVLFFSTIVSQTEVTLNGALNPFLEQTNLAANKELSTEERMFFLDLLKDQSVNIHQTSYSLFLMSRTYVDMSNQYLMPRLSSLSLMITATDDTQRMKLTNQLNSDTQITQTKVRDLVEERKKIYTAMIDQQSEQLTKYLDSLGGPSNANEQTIQQAEQFLQEQNLI